LRDTMPAAAKRAASQVANRVARPRARRRVRSRTGWWSRAGSVAWRCTAGFAENRTGAGRRHLPRAVFSSGQPPRR